MKERVSNTSKGNEAKKHKPHVGNRGGLLLEVGVSLWMVFHKLYPTELHCSMTCHYHIEKKRGFPGGAVLKKPPANAGDTGSSPGPGRSHMPRSN